MKHLALIMLLLFLMAGFGTALSGRPNANLNDRYPSPDGRYTAIFYDYHLYMVSLSPSKLLFTRDLLPQPYIAVSEDWQMNGDFVASDGLTASWSPDGSRFMWTEGTPGTGEGDNYLNGDGRIGMFSAKDESIIMMPDEDGMPYDFSWSPDSQYLLYQGIYNFGTGAGPTVTGHFLITPDNQQRGINLSPQDGRNWGDFYTQSFGWLSESAYIYTIWDVAGELGLYSYDPVLDEVTEVLPAADGTSLNMVEIDPDSGNIIFTTITMSGEADSANIVPNTLYLIQGVHGKPRLVYQPSDWTPATILKASLLDSETVIITFGNGYQSTAEIVILNLADGTVIPLTEN